MLLYVQVYGDSERQIMAVYAGCNHTMYIATRLSIYAKTTLHVLTVSTEHSTLMMWSLEAMNA